MVEPGAGRPRAPLLGLAIEPRADGTWALVEVDGTGRSGTTLHCGSEPACERELLARLSQRHGRGILNVPLPTLGGRQFWADVLVSRGWRIQRNVFSSHCRLLDPRDTRRAWGTFEACRVTLAGHFQKLDPSARPEHLVLLVHGLFRSRQSFARLQRALVDAGYDAQSVNYPSTRARIEEHAEQLTELLGNDDEHRRVSFVTHSLGGIVVRSLLARPAPWRSRLQLGRVVMIAPPNQGSRIAEQLADWLPFQVLAGHSGAGLAPAAVAGLPAPPCEFGVIAGGRGATRGLNPWMEGDNDGTVPVAAAHLDGERDFLLVDALHSFVMNDARAVEATLRFLDCGRFAH